MPCRLGFWIICGLCLTTGFSGMVTYPLDEVLLATLVGVGAGGADDWEGVEEVATGALDWLGGFLPFANGIATGADFAQGVPFAGH